MKEPNKKNQYAIDKNWFRLQEKDSWYLITPLTVIQKENFSDIEKREVNYTSLMTVLDNEFSNKSNS